MTAYVVVCSDADKVHYVEPFKKRVDAEAYKAREAMDTYTNILNEIGVDDERTGIEVRRGCARVFERENEWRWSVHKIKL